MDVNNKIAIITGGIGGIGLVTVQDLLRNGIEYVGIFDLPKSDDQKVLQSLQVLGGEFNDNKFGYYACDVTNDIEFKACYEKVIELKKYVHILINNAAILCDKDIDKSIDINCKAVIKGTLLAIEYMRNDKGGRGGAVVNIASIAGLCICSLYPIYAASKHAIISFVRCMKKHNKLLGVRVLCICPGFTRTSILDPNNTLNYGLNFVDGNVLASTINNAYLQNPSSVSAAIVDIIKKGEDGAVWLVENDNPPCGVREIDESEELRFEL